MNMFYHKGDLFLPNIMRDEHVSLYHQGDLCLPTIMRDEHVLSSRRSLFTYHNA